jgi:hypothetical protein
MSLDDLRRQQREALQSAAQWEAAKRQLEETFSATLSSLEELVRVKTGLEVWTSQGRDKPYFSSSAGLISIRAGEWLVLHFPGLSRKVQEIRIAALDCSLTREGSAWKAHVSEATDDERLELDTICASPCIPLHVGWRHNLWWSGPQDNEKLLVAIADLLLEKDRKSEFILGKPKPRGGKSGSLDRGCLIALVVFAFIILLGVSTVISWLGAHPR